MSILSSLFGKKKEPLPMVIRETLFGDMGIEEWPKAGAAALEFPWSAFGAARSRLAAGDLDGAVAGWRGIVAHPGLESRHYLQAWHFLRQHGQQPPPETAKVVLGVVIEVAMPGGLDLLAAYPEHAARYYNCWNWRRG